MISSIENNLGEYKMFQLIKADVLKQFMESIRQYDMSYYKSKWAVLKNYEVYYMHSHGETMRVHYVNELYDGVIQIICIGDVVDTIKQCNSWDSGITAMVLKIEKTVVEL